MVISPQTKSNKLSLRGFGRPAMFRAGLAQSNQLTMGGSQRSSFFTPGMENRKAGIRNKETRGRFNFVCKCSNIHASNTYLYGAGQIASPESGALSIRGIIIPKGRERVTTCHVKVWGLPRVSSETETVATLPSMEKERPVVGGGVSN